MNRNNSTVTSERRTKYEQAKASAVTPFEVGSERWLRLKAHLEEWKPPMAAILGTVTEPSELGEIYYGTFGPEGDLFEPYRPAWAHKVADISATAHSNGAEALWESGNVVRTDEVSASVVKEAAYDVDNDRVVEGEPYLSAWIKGADAVRFDTSEDAREVAFGLLSAADEFDRVLGNAPEYEVRHHPAAFDEIMIPLTTAQGNLFLTKNSEENEGHWILAADVKDSQLLTFAGTQTLAEEIMRAAHLAERLNREASASTTN